MTRSAMGQDGMSPPVPQPITTFSAYRAGLAATGKSVFSYVLFGTYIGIGALSHDFGFSIGWALVCTVLVWAGPAQVILISALGAGSGLAETALAVGISSARLLPMVVAMLPLLKKGRTPSWKLLLPAHFTAVSMWVEAMRLLPSRREGRIAFCNGLGTGYMITASTATVAGFYLAARLPPLASWSTGSPSRSASRSGRCWPTGRSASICCGAASSAARSPTRCIACARRPGDALCRRVRPLARTDPRGLPAE
jgi:predicted branched-subunit amino acid permease